MGATGSCFCGRRNPQAREAHVTEAFDDDEIDEEVETTVEATETVFDISRTEWTGFVDGPLAEELFRPLEELKNSCGTIYCCNLGFGVEAALVAKRALMDVQKTLRDVYLTDFVSRRSEDEALEVMKTFSSALEGCMLRSLTLDLGELGEKGVEAFAPLLKSQKTLRVLEFHSSNSSLEAAGAIFELLPSIERIATLYFFYTEKGDDPVVTLSELANKCISLEDCNSSKNDQGICGALGEGSGLKVYNLSKEVLMVCLSQVIGGHVCLTEVDLSYSNLQDEGMIAIVRSLKDTSPSLKVLSVAGNDITPKAAPALAECLAVKNLLTTFDAGDNKLKDGGVIAIALSLKHTAPSLSVLIVSGNDITQKAAPALAECLAVKNLLNTFDARNNKLKDDGSVVICKAILEGHEQLEFLDLSINGMSGVGAKAAAEAVANKPKFIELRISNNSITKKGIEAVKDVLRKGINGLDVLGYHGQCKYYSTHYEQCEFRLGGITDSDTE